MPIPLSLKLSKRIEKLERANRWCSSLLDEKGTTRLQVVGGAYPCLQDYGGL